VCVCVCMYICISFLFLRGLGMLINFGVIFIVVYFLKKIVATVIKDDKYWARHVYNKNNVLLFNPR